MKTGRLRALGRLESIPVLVSNYLITPFVAWNPVVPSLKPDGREVASVIEVPLEAILDPSIICEETWELRGGYWRVTFYRFGAHCVWGATARVLGDLAGRLTGQERSTLLKPGSVRPLS